MTETWPKRLQTVWETALCTAYSMNSCVPNILYLYLSTLSLPPERAQNTWRSFISFWYPWLCFYCSWLTSHYTPSLQYLIHTNKLPHNYLKHLTCIHTSILILIGSAFLKFVSFSYLILTLCFPWQKSLGAFKSFRMKLNQKVCWRKALNTFQMLPGIHPKLVWSKTRL